MKIKVTANAFSKNSILRNELLQYFPNSEFNNTGRRFTGDELVSFLSDADGAIIGLEKITDQLLIQLPNLKIIAKYGVGLDNIDQIACKKNNVNVGWTGGVNKLSVAEMTLGFMLDLSRNLQLTSNQLKKGLWNKSGGRQLTAQTIGIIGLGHIGKELVRLLKPFNCTILCHDIIKQNEYCTKENVQSVSLKELLNKSDIVSIHTPLTSVTNGLVNNTFLSSMKKDSYLINTARGPIVVLEDLKKALTNDVILGAAIDVYDVEPPKDKKLLLLQNLICTPHTGGNSSEAVVLMGQSAIKHLNLFFNKN
tara:strand:- start:233 stop:1156 length:924 start_codon:yes stop_codon:yes gene_type:complete